jgi:hypothetical protein
MVEVGVAGGMSAVAIAACADAGLPVAATLTRPAAGRVGRHPGRGAAHRLRALGQVGGRHLGALGRVSVGCLSLGGGPVGCLSLGSGTVGDGSLGSGPVGSGPVGGGPV